MAEVWQPGNIDELERYFDEALSKIAVYELPLHLALKVSLVVFEELHCTVADRIPERFSSAAAMLHYKCALEVLIPYLFKRCKLQKPPKQPLIVTQNTVGTVTDALHFCGRYDNVVHAYTLYHQKQFTGSLSDRVADFQYSSGINLGRSSLNNLLHQYHQQMTIKQSQLSGMLPSSTFPKNSKDSLAKRIRSTDVRTILHSTPEEVYCPIREIVEEVVPRPAVDATANCGHYSLGDCYTVWLEFMTRMLAYKQACEAKSRIDSSFNLLEHRILQLTLPELSAVLANRGAVEYKVALSVLSDLVFDVTATRPDILVQPLIPVPSTEKVLIAPSLIFTTNWEVCTLRNWTRLYQDVYGRVIASKKVELAKSLSSAFGSRGFVISTNRKLTDEQGKTTGDVDLAVFDPSEGLLALFEVKWIIEPDSVRETIRSDTEISHGIAQALRCKIEFEKDRSRFLKQVFPHDDIEVSAVRELKCYVIARGNVGIKDDEENEIYILDYLLSKDTIIDSTNISLRQILSRVVDKQIEISNSIEEGARPLRIKLVGYLIRLPGYGALTRPALKKSLRNKHLHRNDRCICGSGRKYKKCCLALDAYDEDIV